jgi:hypothetical protein
MIQGVWQGIINVTSTYCLSQSQVYSKEVAWLAYSTLKTFREEAILKQQEESVLLSVCT